MQLSPQGFSLTHNQQQVYDIITKRFIAVFDDCSVANTTVIGKAADVAFKTTGKVYKRMAHCFEDPNSKKKADLY
jgi:DNA topoisomerase-3